MRSRFRFSKALALTLTIVASAAPAALASPLAPCGDDDADRFQIVSVYRANRPTHFHWAADRLSDTPGGMVPDAYEPAVAVNIVAQDCAPERLGDFGDESDVFTVWVDPSTLTAQQIRALDQPSMRVRRAAFTVSARPIQASVQRVDAARSTLCDADAMRCEDLVVMQPTAVDAIEPAVGSANE